MTNCSPRIQRRFGLGPPGEGADSKKETSAEEEGLDSECIQDSSKQRGRLLKISQNNEALNLPQSLPPLDEQRGMIDSPLSTARMKSFFPAIL